MAAGNHPIVSNTADQTVMVAPNGCTLYGWSVYENAGTPALASALLRVTDASGDIVAAIKVALSAESTRWFGPQGIHVPGNLFLDFTAGSLTGTIYAG